MEEEEEKEVVEEKEAGQGGGGGGEGGGEDPTQFPTPAMYILAESRVAGNELIPVDGDLVPLFL